MILRVVWHLQELQVFQQRRPHREHFLGVIRNFDLRQVQSLVLLNVHKSLAYQHHHVIDVQWALIGNLH